MLLRRCRLRYADAALRSPLAMRLMLMIHADAAAASRCLLLPLRYAAAGTAPLLRFTLVDAAFRCFRRLFVTLSSPPPMPSMPLFAYAFAAIFDDFFIFYDLFFWSIDSPPALRHAMPLTLMPLPADDVMLATAILLLRP